MKQRLAVIDYGTGNAFSLRKAFERLGTNVDHTANPETIRRSDKIVLPGVGHFGRTMGRLRANGLLGVLNEEVVSKGKPVLGVCLGMELFATASEEGGAGGLNWIGGEMVRISVIDPIRYKVPHVGWNTASAVRTGRLLDGIEAEAEFYFLHSYHFVTQNKTAVMALTEYADPFVSVVEQENIFGVQFHPEKSFENGAKLLSNFLNV
jgi:imidazole glycerol-phosphate synthase subunit HisH